MTPLLIQHAASAASLLASAIWQGILLAAIIALTFRLLSTLRAAARSLIWTVTFAFAILLHLAPRAISGPETPALHIAPTWSLVVAAFWLVLSLTRATQLFLGALALHRLACNATPVSAARTPRRYILCTSPEVDRPSVIGFFRPRILLPPTLFATLTPTELHQVLLHETEHLRRRDDWTNLLQKLALVLFPLNPALIWIERRLCLERELACDDRVLRTTRAPKAYATCLASMAEHTLLRRGACLALGILGVTRHPRHSELSCRVHRILCASQKALSPRRTAGLTTALLVALSAGAFKLAHAPQLISFAPEQTASSTQTVQPEFSSANSSTSARAMLATFKVPQSLSQSERDSVPDSSQPHRDDWVSTPTRATRKPAHRKLRVSSLRVTPLRAVFDTPAEPPIPRFVLTRGSPSQASFTYVPAVAIATPDGWLIIQL